MNNITITECGLERLDDIQPLWEALNAHHALVSSHFADYFKRFGFDQRKAALESKAHRGSLRIFFAEVNDRIAGQCVVTLMPEMLGEIDSIIVDKAYRGKNVGDSLMRAVLDWLDTNGAKSKTVVVVHGNESANAFYAKYGFMPRSTRLSQI